MLLSSSWKFCMCLRREAIRENVLEHDLQETRWSAFWWTAWWVRTVSCLLNFWPHFIQSNFCSPTWISRMCFLRLAFNENVLWHSSHERRFSMPWWTAWWRRKVALVLKSLEQSWQLCFLSITCVPALWILTSFAPLNLFWQISQVNFLSSVWVNFVWVSRLEVWLNVFGHNVHWYGFSPVWTLVCIKRHCFVRNFLGQLSQQSSFSSKWIHSWITTMCFRAELYLQNLQWNCFPTCFFLCSSNDSLWTNDT